MQTITSISAVVDKVQQIVFNRHDRQSPGIFLQFRQQVVIHVNGRDLETRFCQGNRLEARAGPQIDGDF